MQIRHTNTHWQGSPNIHRQSVLIALRVLRPQRSRMILKMYIMSMTMTAHTRNMMHIAMPVAFWYFSALRSCFTPSSTLVATCTGADPSHCPAQPRCHLAAGVVLSL